jgi:hypothetical protein
MPPCHHVTSCAIVESIIRHSPGKILSTSAALIVLICFFLPWVTVSCSEQEVATLSGYDLSVGTDIDLGVGTEEVDPDPIIFVVPLAAVASNIGLGFRIRLDRDQRLGHRY